MKVTDIKTFAVDCFRTNWVFVKVETDEGISGVGEATLEYKEKALFGAIEHIKEYLVGKDPTQIEKHYHDIYRDAYWRGGAVLMSALPKANSIFNRGRASCRNTRSRITLQAFSPKEIGRSRGRTSSTAIRWTEANGIFA